MQRIESRDVALIEEDRPLPPPVVVPEEVVLPDASVRLRKGAKGRWMQAADGEGDAFFEASQLEDALSQLAKVREIVRKHHLDLDMRRSGSVSAEMALTRLSQALNMRWVDGVELQRSRAAQAAAFAQPE